MGSERCPAPLWGINGIPHKAGLHKFPFPPGKELKELLSLLWDSIPVFCIFNVFVLLPDHMGAPHPLGDLWQRCWMKEGFSERCDVTLLALADAVPIPACSLLADPKGVVPVGSAEAVCLQRC